VKPETPESPFEVRLSVPACGCGHHASPVAPQSESTPGCGCRSLGSWRRLHALGAFIFTLFLLTHLLLAGTGRNRQRYQVLALALQSLKRGLPIASWLLAALLLLLGATGIYLLSKAGLSYQVKRCKRGGKLRYALQRWSALTLLAFLGVHTLASLRIYVPADAFASTRRLVGGNPLLLGLSCLGLPALAYHAANGLRTAWEFWKLPEPEGPWPLSTLLAWLLGALLAALGAGAAWAFLV